MATRRLKEIQPQALDYNPLVYQGFTVQPKERNFSPIYQMAKDYEAKYEKANNAIGGIDVAYDKYADKLNPKEKEWLENRKQKYKDLIRDVINTGDLNTAINVGTLLGAEAATDQEARFRADYEANRRKWEDDINSRKDLTPEAKRWAKEKYGQYNYHDLYDNTGTKVIGGSEFEYHDVLPSLNLDEEWQKAYVLTSEYSHGSGGSSKNTSGDVTHSTSSVKSKTEERLIGTMNARYSQIQDQVAQDYYAYVSNLNSMQTQLQKMEDEGKTNTEEYRYLQSLYNTKRAAITNDGTVDGQLITNHETYFKVRVLQEGGKYDNTYARSLAYRNVDGNSTTDYKDEGTKTPKTTPDYNEGGLYKKAIRVLSGQNVVVKGKGQNIRENTKNGRINIPED